MSTPTPTLIRIALNKSKAKVRRVTLHGRPYLVADASLIVEGVLDGSAGPLYYPADEIARNVDAWNGVPLVVYHPTVNGVAVSARDPQVLESSGIGQVWKASSKKGKLRAEAWFDEEVTKKVDARIHNALETNAQIELSTGLYLDLEDAPDGAEYRGKSYEKIARNYRPDHLAILPDQKGACSLDDGCGINNADSSVDDAVVTSNAMSHGDLERRLNEALRSLYTQAEPHCYIAEVYSTYFIYYHGDSLYRVSYTVDGESVSLTSSPSRVERRIEYVTVNESTTLEGDDMKLNATQRKEAISFLTANCDCWKHQGDAEVLNGFSDEKLLALKATTEKLIQQEAVVNAARKGYGLPDNASTIEVKGAIENRATVTVAEGDSTVTANASTPSAQSASSSNSTKPMTAEEWFKNAPPEVQVVVRNGIEADKRERLSLIGQLTQGLTDGSPAKVNVTNRYAAMPTEVLRDLASAIPLVQSDNPFSSHQPRYDYTGAAGGPPTVNAVDDPDDVLPMTPSAWLPPPTKSGVG